MTTTSPRRRLAAVTALVTGAAVLALALVFLVRNPGRLAGALASSLVLVVAGWYAVTRRGVRRGLALMMMTLALAGLAVSLVRDVGDVVRLAVIALVAAISVAAARVALRADVRTLKAAPTPGTAVAAAQRPVLIMNRWSGGGKVEQFNLADEALRRDIEPVMLERGDDLRQLAVDAIEAGADVIGMAGGDGSQALVATVAAERGVAHVCIPAGTRNHFALDLGLDRNDVVGALDAFGEAVERRIDLARVGERVFVNNVSLGIYAMIVQSDEYRDAKLATAAGMLPDLLGPEATPFDLRYTGPDGIHHPNAHLVLVSNNVYDLTNLGGFGTRARMDEGVLGVVAVRLENAAAAAEFVALEAARRADHSSSWSEWSTPTFVVRSDGPIEAGVDGEALLFDSPLEFEAMPGALRVRLPHHAPGHAPAAVEPRVDVDTLRALGRTAVGR